jgi:hypothetical protein
MPGPAVRHTWTAWTSISQATAGNLCDLGEGIQTRSLEQTSPISWQTWMQKSLSFKEKDVHTRVDTWSVSMRADLCFVC